MIFNCIYCGHEHPQDLHTFEHIIPEALNNKKYVISNACNYFNNYMAHSFENRIIKSEIIKEIMLLIYPPKKAIYRRMVTTSSKPGLSQWIHPSGECKPAQMVQYTKTNTIEITGITDHNGNQYNYDLKLPFSINETIGTSWIPNINRPSTEIEKKISTYLEQLTKNISLNPEFENFLREINATFNDKDYKSVFKETKGPPIILTPEEESQLIEVDHEALYKLFLKIAWTHSVKQFGREKLSNPIADKILCYIKSGHIEYKKIIKRYSNLVSNAIKINGNEYFFWKYGVNQSAKWVQDNLTSEYQSYIKAHLTDRVDKFNYFSRFVQYSIINLMDNKLRERRKEFKFHEIGLKSLHVHKHNVITVCSIKLFGGIFDATVQISEEPLAIKYPEFTRIDF